VAVTTTFRSEHVRRALFGVLCAGLLAGCSSCGEQPNASEDAAVAELSPVPEPADLAGEIFVSKPDETWTKVRAVGGGAARLLPQSFGLLMTTLLGVRAAIADYIDADLPMTGVLLSGDKGTEPGVVLAVHVKSGRELVTGLSSGADARYSARPDAATSITLLDPKPGKASEEVALGVLGNYLLVSRHSADVLKGGPYAARTLPKQSAPAHPVSVKLKKSALAGPLARLLKDTWKAKRAELVKADQANRQRHGGRTPDFGDPAAALRGIDSAVEGLAAVLESAEGGTLTLDPFEDRVELTLSVRAGAKGAAAEMIADMSVGDAKPLLKLPKATPIAVLVRSTGAQRQARAKSLAEGVSELFGDRMSKPESEKVLNALDTLAKGRGDEETYALYFEGTHGGLVYDAPVSDAKAFGDGAKSVARLLDLKVFAEPLRAFIGDTSVKLSKADVAGIPGAERALITVKPSPMRAAKDPSGKVTVEPQTIEGLWAVQDGRAKAVVATDAVPILGSLFGTDEKKTHAADAKVKLAIERVKDASFVAFVQPLRMNMGQSASLASESPVVLSFGRKDKDAFVHLDVDQPALEMLLKTAVLGGR